MPVEPLDLFGLICRDLSQWLQSVGRTDDVIVEAAIRARAAGESAVTHGGSDDQMREVSKICTVLGSYIAGYIAVAQGKGAADTRYMAGREELRRLLPIYLAKHRLPRVEEPTAELAGQRFASRPILDAVSVVVDTSFTPDRAIGVIIFHGPNSYEAFDVPGNSYGRFTSSSDAKSEIIQRYPDRR